MRTLLLLFSFLGSVIFTRCADAQTSVTNALMFFVVSAQPVPEGHYVDTPDFPKLGYVSNTPSLVITQLGSVFAEIDRKTLSYDAEGKRTYEPTITIELSVGDQRRFAEFTRTNRGEIVLLKLGDRPLAAPRIVTPIENGSMKVTLREEKVMRRVADDLKTLVRRE
jgi:preprotein translocase subunit SecD